MAGLHLGGVVATGGGGEGLGGSMMVTWFGVQKCWLGLLWWLC